MNSAQYDMRELLNARGMTTYEKLESLPGSEKQLKPNVGFNKLDELAKKSNDNNAAQTLKTERGKLFKLIFEQDKKRA